MNVNVSIIQSYPNTLLESWCSWNRGVLAGYFPANATSFTEAIQDSGSSGRSRAKECFQIGLLKYELSNRDVTLNLIRDGKNVQSDLGYITDIIFSAYKANSNNQKLARAYSAINVAFSLIQYIEIGDLKLSVNSLIQKLLNAFPKAPDVLLNDWCRYLLSGLFCEIGEAEDDSLRAIYDFVSGKRDEVTLRIIGNTQKNDGNSIQRTRATFKNSQDVLNAINDSVSLTNIVNQKRPLFIFGVDKSPGFYSIAESFFDNVLREYADVELATLNSNPFLPLYDDSQTEQSGKWNPLEFLKGLSHNNPQLTTPFNILMKSIEDGAIDALASLTDKPVSFFKDLYSANNEGENEFFRFVTALRTKPFMLLAGISGTGKSRVVRKLAQATVTEEIQRNYDDKFSTSDFESDRWNLHSPANFELIQVKPNWHTSMDVIGYLSNINGRHYEFLRSFIL